MMLNVEEGAVGDDKVATTYLIVITVITSTASTKNVKHTSLITFISFCPKVSAEFVDFMPSSSVSATSVHASRQTIRKTMHK